MHILSSIVYSKLAVLVDFPVTAKFLTPEERAFVVWTKSKCVGQLTMIPSNAISEYDNSSVGEEEHFKSRHLYQAFTDWQVILL